MSGLRALLVGLMAAGGLAACSGSSGPPRPDAARDAAATVDAPPSDRRVDASGGADRHDAAPGADRPDAAAVCSPLDLPTQCPEVDAGECQPTWTEALANPQCAGTPAILTPLSRENRLDCGGYHIRQITHNVSAETYYYDVATGALVAIRYSGQQTNSGKCFGPSQGVAANCPNATPVAVCTLYGGDLSDDSDAGLPVDGGDGNCLSTTGYYALSFNAPCPRDGGTACYAGCTLDSDSYNYVGCVADSAVTTRCYASCAACP
ncbi:MAG TPA: hypothetical protein VKZ18_13660 [Polyangia bacterium]|nr:hypothetical protein [Polyangia bacterium]